MAEVLTGATPSGPGGTAIVQPGVRYSLVRGDDFYGILEVSSPVPQLLERFPLDADGWFTVRRRLEELNTADRVTDSRAPSPTRAPGSSDAPKATAHDARLVHAGVVLVGVVLGIAGMFPTYLSGASLTAQRAELLPHIAYVAAWALVASLLIVDRRFVRAAAGIGIGLSVMTFGFFLTDVCTAATSTAAGAGAGLYLSIAGWAVSSSGCVAALLALRSSNELGRAMSWQHPIVALGGALGLATAAAFALPWDRYVLTSATSGSAETITAGNAFSNPGVVIAANLVVMVATFALLLLAFAWRPVVLGVTLVVGTLVPLAAQIFSALIQGKPPLGEFGISAAQAAANRVTLEAGYTGWFYVYCALVAVVVLLLGWRGSAAQHEASV